MTDQKIMDAFVDQSLEIIRLKDANRELLEALKVSQAQCKSIAGSNWRQWEELATPEEFERWVKSRAAHIDVILSAAIAKAEGKQ